MIDPGSNAAIRSISPTDGALTFAAAAFSCARVSGATDTDDFLRSAT